MPNLRIRLQNKPFKHYLVKSSKKIHGWFAWPKRECSCERFLLNPYNGCSLGCFYCYSRALPGYFQEFHRNGRVFVFEEFDKLVASQLDSIDIGFCGYLSPVTEPFQKIDKFYNLSAKLVKVFIERNLPIEFITKERVPQEVINLIRTQEHSFGQISILSPDSKLNRLLSPGADLEVLFANIRRLTDQGVYSVARIDPILPFISDDKKGLTRLMTRISQEGVKHVVASVLDIPPRIKGYVLTKIARLFGRHIKDKYLSLYKEKIGYLNACIDYRKEVFGFLRKQADSLGLTFSLCMEYESQKGNIIGLNKQFSSALNCEGLNIPIYKRKGGRFYPQQGCRGNCLSCSEAVCGIDELAYAKTKKPLALKYSDYRRFSKIQTITD
ncbi:MAG: radical SAM protein [Candidatus Omnitrophica bacterium]|nr:radical SAM protein [Candidatus Omnitrophota bacterium]